MNNSIVTRIAPSPTGRLHIGTARTALFNFLFARRHHGTFVVRIEDTDHKRSTPEFEHDILDGLAWLGLSHDVVYRQSERAKQHRVYLETLIHSGKAYESLEPSREDPNTNVSLVRLRNPGSVITFVDLIRGPITFDTAELGDIVLARSLDNPLYHFAVVADDADSGVTHVIRGEDHISNTPRQILIQEALGFPRPTYAHLPLILAPDRSKLSKRHGATALRAYRDDGYLPAAIINYLALLGWSPKDETEFFTLEELSNVFDVAGIHKAGAMFSIDKLNWYNAHYLRALPQQAQRTYLQECLAGNDVVIQALQSPAFTADVLERVHSCRNLREIVAQGEFSFLERIPPYDPARLMWKHDTDIDIVQRRLEHLYSLLSNISVREWNAQKVKEAVWPYAETEGKGSVLWPFRYALTGQERSPDPFIIAEVLGKDTTLTRLSQALPKNLR